MSADIEEKIGRFESFIKQDPNNINLANELMDLYLQAGNYEAAITMYEQAAQPLATDAAFLFKASNALLARGNFEAAIASLKQIKAQGITQLGIDFNLAFAYFYNREFSHAEEAISAVLEQWQEHPPIVILAARIFHFTDRLEEACRYLKSYIKQNQSDAEAWGLLSLIALDGDIDTAEKQREYAKTALQINPEQMEAMLTLAQLDLGEQDVAAAADITEKAVALHPTSGRAWSYKGQSDMLNLDLVKAEASLDKAVKYMPDHIGTWHALAWCALLRDNVDKADACFKSALKLDRNFAESHGGDALIHFLKGNIDEAKTAARRGVGLDKNGFTARYVQALILEKEGNIEEAKSIIEDIMASDTGAQAKVFIEMLRQNNEELKPKLH